MPKRKDIKKILIIGAGPIIIGQACEFDYSGTQACKALKDEGYKVILINSNPATIMTDPGVADKTYIEPITVEVLEEVIKKEKPDVMLPTMGGQTALNLAIKAEKIGLLKKYKIELIGANSKAISNAEDRKKFRKNMSDIGIDLPKSEIINNFSVLTTCPLAALDSSNMAASASKLFTSQSPNKAAARSNNRPALLVVGQLICLVIICFTRSKPCWLENFFIANSAKLCLSKKAMAIRHGCFAAISAPGREMFLKCAKRWKCPCLIYKHSPPQALPSFPKPTPSKLRAK